MATMHEERTSTDNNQQLPDLLLQGRLQRLQLRILLRKSSLVTSHRIPSKALRPKISNRSSNSWIHFDYRGLTANSTKRLIF